MEISIIEIFLLAATVIALGGVIFFYINLRKIKEKYTTLTEGVKTGNLEELLDQHLKKIKQLSLNVEQLEKEIKNIHLTKKNYYYRTGFERFNPFHETGGDQSFILALLNDNNDGFLLSSLHQRDLTRVYAKEITNGKTKQKLSDEEQKVLTTTLQKNGTKN